MTSGWNLRILRGGKGILLSTALTVPLLIGGCGVFSEEEVQPSGLSAEAQPSENESYPNLGSVPSERPTVTSAEQRQALRESLQEQRSDGLPTMPNRELKNGYSSGGQRPPTPRPAPESAPDPDMSRSSGMSSSQSMTQANSQPASNDGVSYQPPQPRAQQYAQATYDNGGMLMAGDTPPNMVQPMAYNQGGYGMGTTVISSQGATQPSMQSGGGYGPGSQMASANPAAAYAGAENLAGVIYFQHGSSGLDGKDRQILRKIAEAQQARGGSVIVVGHASARTRNLEPDRHFEANLATSQRRANAVAEALRSFGVPGNSLYVEARGAAQPVFQEVMPSGEAGNRRVEIYLR